MLFLCAWECLIINKKHFLATQNTKCGYPAKIRMCGSAWKCIRILLSFSYTQTQSWLSKKRGGRQVLSCECYTWSWRFLHDLARFEWLARAHCPAGASDLVHFVVKIAVKKRGPRRFLCYWLSYVTSILVFYFSRFHKNISNLDLDWRELVFIFETGRNQNLS